jgi:hypothetical protein
MSFNSQDSPFSQKRARRPDSPYPRRRPDSPYPRLPPDQQSEWEDLDVQLLAVNREIGENHTVEAAEVKSGEVKSGEVKSGEVKSVEAADPVHTEVHAVHSIQFNGSDWTVFWANSPPTQEPRSQLEQDIAPYWVKKAMTLAGTRVILYEVAAIRFIPQQGWKVWWDTRDCPSNDVQEEDFQFLKVEPQKVSEAKQTGRRIMLVGMRSGTVGLPLEPNSTPNLSAGLPETTACIKFQQEGGFCALNSVRNLVDLEPLLEEAIRANGGTFSLPQVAALVNRWPGGACRLEKVHGVVRDKMADHLQGLREGRFVIQFGKHCASWDAGKRLILDTDPQFPTPLEITPSNLEKLKIKKIEKTYQLIEKQKKLVK